MLQKLNSYIAIFFLYMLSCLPMFVLYGISDILFFFVYRVLKYRRKVVRTNLKNSFPSWTDKELDNYERKYFAYLADVIMEIIKMATISKNTLNKHYKFKNAHLINAYLDRGESVLACSAHYGNWEGGTLAIGLNVNGDSYAIYKPLNNLVFDKWFKHIRTRFGNRMVPMRQTLREIAATKDKASLFCFGNDQAPGKHESHEWITFLNQQTSFQQGIEKIAIKTGRPIFYIKVKVVKRGYYELDCVPLLENPAQKNRHEITLLHARFLEQTILSDPTYWLWSHRRWKHQPTE